MSWLGTNVGVNNVLQLQSGCGPVLLCGRDLVLVRLLYSPGLLGLDGHLAPTIMLACFLINPSRDSIRKIISDVLSNVNNINGNLLIFLSIISNIIL